MSTYKWKTDRDKERNGIEVETSLYGTFVVRRMGSTNKPYQMALEQRFKKYRRLKDHTQIPLEVRERLLLEAFCEEVLVGWKEDVTGPDDKPLKFSVENAMTLFQDIPEILEELIPVAEAPDAFRDMDREAVVGNSSKSSGTK